MELAQLLIPFEATLKGQFSEICKKLWVGTAFIWIIHNKTMNAWNSVPNAASLSYSSKTPCGTTFPKMHFVFYIWLLIKFKKRFIKWNSIWSQRQIKDLNVVVVRKKKKKLKKCSSWKKKISGRNPAPEIEQEGRPQGQC